MDFYPRNEAEISTYEFSFNLTTAALTTDMFFLIRFPIDYDPNLYKNAIYATSAQLKGQLNVRVIHRNILVTGF